MNATTPELSLSSVAFKKICFCFLFFKLCFLYIYVFFFLLLLIFFSLLQKTKKNQEQPLFLTSPLNIVLLLLLSKSSLCYSAATTQRIQTIAERKFILSIKKYWRTVFVNSSSSFYKNRHHCSHTDYQLHWQHHERPRLWAESYKRRYYITESTERLVDHRSHKWPAPLHDRWNVWLQIECKRRQFEKETTVDIGAIKYWWKWVLWNKNMLCSHILKKQFKQ